MNTSEEVIDQQKPSEEPINKDHKDHKKVKPLDTDGIIRWKLEPFKPEHSSGPFLEVSSFATLFPRYRESYIREIWPLLTDALDKHGIKCELDLLGGKMTVETTRKTFDPYIILKARDLIKLLSRSVPLANALQVLRDDKACDIIKIGDLVRNKETFVKRRQRLLGPKGNTLKALEILTKCYIQIQGNTVATIGPFKGIKAVRKVVTECMNNIHPVYYIKELMIRRELEADEKLKHESWDRFLPKFHKKNYNQPKPIKRKTKVYTPFPPEQTPSKVDLQLESGEYFLKPAERARRELERKKQQQKENSASKQEKRKADFIAPEEPVGPKPAAQPQVQSWASLKEKLAKRAKQQGTTLSRVHAKDSVEHYISKNAS